MNKSVQAIIGVVVIAIALCGLLYYRTGGEMSLEAIKGGAPAPAPVNVPPAPNPDPYSKF